MSKSRVEAFSDGAFAASWVSPPLALALCGLMALYNAFDQASVAAERDPVTAARRTGSRGEDLAR